MSSDVCGGAHGDHVSQQNSRTILSKHSCHTAKTRLSYSGNSGSGVPYTVMNVQVSINEQAEHDVDSEVYFIPAQREACKRKALSRVRR
jgi:hypothetical protein